MFRNCLADVADFSAPVGGGRLNQTHLELLFPSFPGDPLIVCAACEMAGCVSVSCFHCFSCQPVAYVLTHSSCSVRYQLAVETPLEELSAHMEENHLDVVDGIVAVTQGMSKEETRRWFASLD